ncbi:MAG: PIN domain-containing protein, partial [Thermodesulfovibrionales bacterium]
VFFLFHTMSIFAFPFIVFGIASFLTIEYGIRRLPFGFIVGGLSGVIIGSVTAFVLSYPIKLVFEQDMYRIVSFYIFAVLISGFAIAMSNRCSNLTLQSIRESFSPSRSSHEMTSVLDTSVLIDGRIADIVDAGFMTGRFILPQFVIQELQYIADSPDAVRRIRGRRGIDIVKKMQKMSHIQMQILDDNFPNIKDVDSKIIALASSIGAKIITNDYNLQKIAQLQGIGALNINELANILKTLVIPGERLTLFVAKEGKEQGQGVAYLDDGTMVVVENGRRCIGKTVELEVTSVLQTSSGRMIFARTIDDKQS